MVIEMRRKKYILILVFIILVQMNFSTVFAESVITDDSSTGSSGDMNPSETREMKSPLSGGDGQQPPAMGEAPQMSNSENGTGNAGNIQGNQGWTGKGGRGQRPEGGMVGAMMPGGRGMLGNSGTLITQENKTEALITGISLVALLLSGFFIAKFKKR